MQCKGVTELNANDMI